MDAFGFLYKLSGSGQSWAEQLTFTPGSNLPLRQTDFVKGFGHAIPINYL